MLEKYIIFLYLCICFMHTHIHIHTYLSIYICLYIYRHNMYIYIYMWGSHVWSCKCVSQHVQVKGQIWKWFLMHLLSFFFFLSYLPSCFSPPSLLSVCLSVFLLRQLLSLGSGAHWLARLSGQLTLWPGFSASSAPELERARHAGLFRQWGPNSGPHTCVQSLLTTLPSS